MSERKRFEYVLEPDTDGGWHAFIPSVRGCRTWGRSIAAARRYIREALATCVDVLGENAEQIAHDAELVEKVVLEGSAKKSLEEYFTVRDQAAKLHELAQIRVRDAAVKLTKHLSLRDAGELLGLSHERVSQVITVTKDKITVGKKVGAKEYGGTFIVSDRMLKKKPQARRSKGAA